VNVLVSFPGAERATARQEVRRQPRARSRTATRHGFLPVPATPLIGREPDLAIVRGALEDGGVAAARLMTLVGAPGTGKTRLAIAAAERLVETYEDGVYFVDLMTLTDAEAVPAVIAHTLGATYRGRRPMSLEQTLKRALRDRHVLLVLDNFEVVLDAGAFVDS
jgi:Cdc6-like AAA superfamily ATPase